MLMILATIDIRSYSASSHPDSIRLRRKPIECFSHIMSELFYSEAEKRIEERSRKMS